ncbi:hypothetical protein [Ponticaulis sp.]|uniref:hypothetical protein n=1 Tax=Ponticaulis sp. TaxID=2020902 RepID=UPI000B694865|nr:hypothetical protein [Ponticaulis sp.]MAI90796.1 hypothetical protein [Ponticaulis sp.]OUX99020.1 MAG: hypothetical protein CBB65_10170 [Hyphomonadaceae bacterium TMED5]|tara:strand:+ start:77328 stop:77657 length:330 start_codon:yes stop_codon:yes gene_type:complete
MPKLVKFLIFHAFLGFAIALACVVVIFALDLAHLRTLILGSDIKWIAVAALIILMTITLASVTMGIAIMRMPYDDDDDDTPGGGLRQHGVWDTLLGQALLQPEKFRVRR